MVIEFKEMYGGTKYPFHIELPWGEEKIVKMATRFLHPEHGIKANDIENVARLGALVLMHIVSKTSAIIPIAILERAEHDTTKQNAIYALPEKTKVAIAACIRDWEDLTQEHIWEISRCYAEFSKINHMKQHPRKPSTIKLNIRHMIESCERLPTMDFLLGRRSEDGSKTIMRYAWEPPIDKELG